MTTHAALVRQGIPVSTVVHRLGPDGPWQRLLPGVVLLHNGIPTWRERVLGALAYAGDGALITGNTALRLYGVKAAAAPATIHVLIPHERRRQGRPDLLVERTRKLPSGRVRQTLPVAPPARALVDACRTMTNLDDVRGLVAEVLQTGLCSIDDISNALGHAARQRTAVTRRVLAEMAAGVRSVAEAKVRALIRRHRLPEPLWNRALHTASGELIAVPDGYWALLGVALQIDSMEWHLSPLAYKRTQRRQRALEAHGIPVLPVAPGDVFADELAFVRELGAFLERNAGHQPPTDVVVSPRAA